MKTIDKRIKKGTKVKIAGMEGIQEVKRVVGSYNIELVGWLGTWQMGHVLSFSNKKPKIKDLIVSKKEFDTEHGFFFVEFADGRSVQCCLLENDGSYIERVSLEDNGFDEGTSYDCNEWAIEAFGDVAVNRFLVKQSKG